MSHFCLLFRLEAEQKLKGTVCAVEFGLDIGSLTAAIWGGGSSLIGVGSPDPGASEKTLQRKGLLKSQV